jgi:hypothetical protein
VHALLVLGCEAYVALFTPLIENAITHQNDSYGGAILRLVKNKARPKNRAMPHSRTTEPLRQRSLLSAVEQQSGIAHHTKTILLTWLAGLNEASMEGRIGGAGLAGVLMAVFDISRLRCTALFLQFFE